MAPIFEFNEPDLLTIAERLRDLSPSTSCGTDGITFCLLKFAGPTMLQLIHHICCLSIRKNTFPDSWKVAINDHPAI